MKRKYINTYFKCTKVNLGLMFFGEGSDFNSKLGKPEIRTIGRARFGSSYQRNQKENANRSVNDLSFTPF